MKYFNPSSKSGVYEIENLVNGKRYVGGTVNFRQRFRDHRILLQRGKHYNNHLQASVNKYGIENFLFKEIAICHASLIKDLEQWYLDNEGGDYNFETKVIKKGDPSINRRFLAEEIRKMRWLITEGYLLGDIGKLYKTNRTTMHDISHGNSYAEITEVEEVVDEEVLKQLRKRQTYSFTQFTFAEVRGIRYLSEQGLGRSEIARQKGVTAQAISTIVLNKSYKHVKQEGEVDTSWFKVENMIEMNDKVKSIKTMKKIDESNKSFIKNIKYV